MPNACSLGFLDELEIARDVDQHEYQNHAGKQ